jgi:transposase
LIVDLARFMTLADIAGWLCLSWDTVRTVVQRRLEKDYRRIGYRKVHAIAIDELYLGRARKYITLVIDLQNGRIIWVEQGRGSGALREFWRRFKLSGARLKAVAMDMSGAYAASVRAHAPHAIMTFDRFHVIKLMNERLDDLRRELAREAHNHNAREAIKGLRWLLLHRRDNLAKDAATRLERSLALNAMCLPAQGGTRRTLGAKRRTAGLGIHARMVRPGKSQRHPATPSDGADPPSSCQGGPELLQDRADQRKMEGINRKIRGLLASAFGFRDHDFLKLRLYALHEAKFKFVG